MKTILKYIILVIMCIFGCIVTFNEHKLQEEKKYVVATLTTYEKDNIIETNLATDTNDSSIILEEKSIPTEVIIDPIVYDNMTMSELINKLDRSLSSNLTGYGYLYASKSLELGIDPYLALAITLHETGCEYNCSNLVKSCNNVGGQKGYPGCGGGEYKAYDTLEEGIVGYLNNLYNNYYAYGLTTINSIGAKYAESSTWPIKISNYVEKIQNN